MITHGRQQILPPNMIIGRTQIQGACIGIERIVGLWLGWQAVQAILGAFGQTDGTAVIKATNAYLNQLAASDRDKATALAGFINEDPMMVCSLGLQVEGVTMPIRWLVGDGNCWIDSGRKATATSIYHMKWKRTANIPVWGSPFIGVLNSDYNANAKNFCIDVYGTRFRYMVGTNGSWSEITSSVDCSIGKVLDTTMSGTLLKSNGVTVKSGNSGFTGTNYNIWFFARNKAGVKEGVAAMAAAICETEDNSALVQRLIPIISTDKVGMIDLVDMTYHPKQGTGTMVESMTQADGVTPWTPSTP